jgi:hypothetical protein
VQAFGSFAEPPGWTLVRPKERTSPAPLAAYSSMNSGASAEVSVPPAIPTRVTTRFAGLEKGVEGTSELPPAQD